MAMKMCVKCKKLCRTEEELAEHLSECEESAAALAEGGEERDVTAEVEE